MNNIFIPEYYIDLALEFSDGEKNKTIEYIDKVLYKLQIDNLNNSI